jgi:hypothetical protein
MVIIISSGKICPTELTWEEKNTDDYSYKAKDISSSSIIFVFIARWLF